MREYNSNGSSTIGKKVYIITHIPKRERRNTLICIIGVFSYIWNRKRGKCRYSFGAQEYSFGAQKCSFGAQKCSFGALKWYCCCKIGDFSDKSASPSVPITKNYSYPLQYFRNTVIRQLKKQSFSQLKNSVLKK